jgi:hypothetical protein
MSTSPYMQRRPAELGAFYAPSVSYPANTLTLEHCQNLQASGSVRVLYPNSFALHLYPCQLFIVESDLFLPEATGRLYLYLGAVIQSLLGRSTRELEAEGTTTDSRWLIEAFFWQRLTVYGAKHFWHLVAATTALQALLGRPYNQISRHFVSASRDLIFKWQWIPGLPSRSIVTFAVNS